MQYSKFDLEICLTRIIVKIFMHILKIIKEKALTNMQVLFLFVRFFVREIYPILYNW